MNYAQPPPHSVRREPRPAPGRDRLRSRRRVGALHDNKRLVRLRAAGALIKLGHRSDLVVATLVEALEDKEVSIYGEASQLLANMGSDARSAVVVLMKGLDDGKDEIALTAAKALGEIGAAASQA